MAADSRRRRARRVGKMEREGFARRRERGEGVAVAGRGAGERSEAGTRRLRAERLTRERASANTRRTENTHAAGWRTKSPRWPEGQPRAPLAVGAR